MPLYEHVFLARQDASTQQVEELTTQMTGIVEGLGGKVVKMESWGVRSRTYRMNKTRKAPSGLLNITAPSATGDEAGRPGRAAGGGLRPTAAGSNGGGNGTRGPGNQGVIGGSPRK